MTQQTIFDAMQMNIFDFLQPQEQPKWIPQFNVGDKVHYLVVGEICTATVTGFGSTERYNYYQTNRGSFFAEELEKTFEQFQRESEAIKAKYKIIKPHDLEKRVTVEYTSMTTGNKLWGQIGIYDGMLYCKGHCCLEILKPYPTEKALMKAYDEALYQLKMLDQTEQVRSRCPYRYVEEEHEMANLYWSDWGKCYAEAKYIKQNG